MATKSGEIREVLQSGTIQIAKTNRLGKEKVFEFNQVLNNKFFQQKKVIIIYIIENAIVVIITVIVKYGTF